MKRFEQVRLHTVIRQIHRLFTENRPTNKGPKPKLIAKEALAQLKASHVTIIKARKALGVESRQIAGKHMWKFPQRSLEQALEKIANGRTSSIYKVKKVKDETPEAKKILTDIMQSLHYNGLAKEIREGMKSHGLRRNMFIFRAKKELDIQNVWQPDGWHWIMPAEEVCEWLSSSLKSGVPMLFDELLQRATEKQWSQFVLRAARHKLGGIKSFRQEGLEYWHDPVNTPESFEGETEEITEL